MKMEVRDMGFETLSKAINKEELLNSYQLSGADLELKNKNAPKSNHIKDFDKYLDKKNK